MKIAIAGITGFVGSYVAQYLSEQGHTIIPLLRKDFEQLLIPDKIANTDAVVNFTGYPIIKRWTKSNKKRIIESRVETTASIINALSIIKNAPKILINASAIGLYSNNIHQTEAKYTKADNFLSEVVEAWESEATKCIYSDTRLVIMRLGIVLGEQGGVVKKLKPLFSKGLGGNLGKGNQVISFIHIHDLARAVNYFLTDNKCQDSYNITTPNSISNKEFTKAFASAMGKKVGFAVPEFMLKWMFGKASIMLLESQDAYPERLINDNFEFKFPDINSCFQDIFKK